MMNWLIAFCIYQTIGITIFWLNYKQIKDDPIHAQVLAFFACQFLWFPFLSVMVFQKLRRVQKINRHL